MRGPGRRAELARDCARPAWPPSPTGCLAACLPAWPDAAAGPAALPPPPAWP